MKEITYHEFPPTVKPDSPGHDHCQHGTGPSFTFLCPCGRLACCIGLIIHWKGCADVWLSLAEHWYAHPVEAVIWTRRVLDMLQARYRLRRMQADVLASDRTACRFIEHYGFVQEGRMRAYDVLGRDHFRYARIREVA